MSILNYFFLLKISVPYYDSYYPLNFSGSAADTHVSLVR